MGRGTAAEVLVCMPLIQGSWLGQQPATINLPSWLQKEDGSPIGEVSTLHQFDLTVSSSRHA